MPELTFLRYERKYFVPHEIYPRLRKAIEPYVTVDTHCINGGYFVSDRYYDTDNYALAVEALLKPTYREKLRVRCYLRGEFQPDDAVFLEQKMKVNGFGHKRRLALTRGEAEAFIQSGRIADETQPAREIEYLLERRNLLPSADITYYRAAFTAADDPGVRITFDTDLYAYDERSGGSIPLLTGDYLMEVKVPHSLPLWLTRAIGESGAHPVSFSKYGRFYYNLCGFEPRLIKENKTYA